MKKIVLILLLFGLSSYSFAVVTSCSEFEDLNKKATARMNYNVLDDEALSVASLSVKIEKDYLNKQNENMSNFHRQVILKHERGNLNALIKDTCLKNPDADYKDAYGHVALGLYNHFKDDDSYVKDDVYITNPNKYYKKILDRFVQGMHKDYKHAMSQLAPEVAINYLKTKVKVGSNLYTINHFPLIQALAEKEYEKNAQKRLQNKFTESRAAANKKGDNREYADDFRRKYGVIKEQLSKEYNEIYKVYKPIYSQPYYIEIYKSLTFMDDLERFFRRETAIDAMHKSILNDEEPDIGEFNISKKRISLMMKYSTEVEGIVKILKGGGSSKSAQVEFHAKRLKEILTQIDQYKSPDQIWSEIYKETRKKPSKQQMKIRYDEYNT